MPLALAWGWNSESMSVASSRMLIGWVLVSSRPTSIFEKSRMSSSTPRSESVARLIDRASSRASLSRSVVASSSARPRMPWMGVRSSWLTLAMNSVRSRSDCSA